MAVTGFWPYYMRSTPTLPKFFWEVKSQEQLIEEIGCIVNGLASYVDDKTATIDGLAEQVKALEDLFKQFQESGFDDYYREQISQWVDDNMESIIAEAVKMVFFGLTDDGRFTAYIPQSWDGIVFDTVMDYGTPEYGCLVLKY